MHDETNKLIISEQTLIFSNTSTVCINSVILSYLTRHRIYESGNFLRYCDLLHIHLKFCLIHFPTSVINWINESNIVNFTYLCAVEARLLIASESTHREMLPYVRLIALCVLYPNPLNRSCCSTSLISMLRHCSSCTIRPCNTIMIKGRR